MKKERIFKIGPLAYIKLFDMRGRQKNNVFVNFRDSKKEYECYKLIWRFYYIYDSTNIK
jgi:hypothetical protein